MTVQLETGPMALPIPDTDYSPQAFTEQRTHANEVLSRYDPYFKELQPGERVVIDTRKPLASIENVGGMAKAAAVALVRAGTDGHLGYRPWPLLDESKELYMVVDRGDDYRKGDRFAVVTQAGRDYNGEARVYGVTPNDPLQIGRRALAKATYTNGDPIRHSFKVLPEHFEVEHDSKSGELSVVYTGDDNGYGMSIVANDPDARHVPRHKADPAAETPDAKIYVPRHML